MLDSELLHRFHVLSESTSILKTLILWPLDDSRPFSVGIHSNNLTHFTARDIGVRQALEILRLSPHLQECSLIDLRADYDDIPLPASHLLLIHLETLVVEVSDPELIPDQLLGNINLPSLKNFNYNGRYIFPLPFDCTVAFLNRSRCLLTSFSLQYAPIAEELIIRLLFAMPDLEVLSLNPSRYTPYVTNLMLKKLAETTAISAHLKSHPDGPFLPNLRSLTYRGPLTFSWKQIPMIFGHGTKEPGASESSKGNRRPLCSLRMELYCVEDFLRGFRNENTDTLDQDLNPDADVIADLKRLRTEEGYEIQVLDISDIVDRDLLHGERI